MRGVETPSINWDFIKIYKQKTKMQNILMVPMFYLKSGVVKQLLLIGRAVPGRRFAPPGRPASAPQVLN